jgi:hypothetical protein
LLADAERAHFVLQSLLEIVPAAFTADAAPPACLRNRCKTARQDFRGAQPNRCNQFADFGLALVDEVGAGFGMLAVKKLIAEGEDAPADAIAGINDRDSGAFRD